METFDKFWKRETGRKPDFSQDRDFDARVVWNAAIKAAISTISDRSIKKMEKLKVNYGNTR